MADLLIKGIDLPKHDDGYVIFTVYGDGGVVHGSLNRPHMRYKNRAVPVPPHGRLIDADDLYEKTAELEAQALHLVGTHEEWQKWATILTERTAFKYDIADATTVIEASKDGEQDGKL